GYRRTLQVCWPRHENDSRKSEHLRKGVAGDARRVRQDAREVQGSGCRATRAHRHREQHESSDRGDREVTAMSVNAKELEAKVKEMYRDVATNPHGEFHFEMGRVMAERLGYLAEDLDRVPPEAIESFAGV